MPIVIGAEILRAGSKPPDSGNRARFHAFSILPAARVDVEIDTFSNHVGERAAFFSGDLAKFFGLLVGELDLGANHYDDITSLLLF